jgi:hypothetical protein
MLFCQSNKGVSAQLHILFLFSPKSEANILNRFGNCSRKSRIGDTDQTFRCDLPVKAIKIEGILAGYSAPYVCSVVFMICFGVFWKLHQWAVDMRWGEWRMLRLRGYVLAWVPPDGSVLAAPVEGLTWRTPRVPSPN